MYLKLDKSDDSVNLASWFVMYIDQLPHSSSFALITTLTGFLEQEQFEELRLL